MLEDELTEQIIGAAIEVHKHWGPGLYEEIYENSMCVELRLRKLLFEKISCKSPGKDGHDETWPSTTLENRLFSTVEGRALSRPRDFCK